MRRFVTCAALGAVLLSATAVFAGPEAEPKRGLSKAELVNSYKPAVVNGMPWYRGAPAVKLHNERRGDRARPIVLMRILGDFDGGT